MTDKEKIRNIIELFIAWNGETEAIDIANIDSAVEFIDSSLQPVSEELKKAALEYATRYDKNWSEVKDGYIAENEVEAFKAGAQWQEEKDDEEKVLTYKHVFKDCKEHIKEILLSEVLPYFMHGGEADGVVAKLDEVLN